MTVSGILIVIGVVMFAFARSRQSITSGNVVVWGTMADTDFVNIRNFLVDIKEIEQNVEYVAIDSNQFDNELTTALAEGRGPDVVMITDDKLIRHRDKLFQINYEVYDERSFKDTFIEAGEKFKDDKGIFGFPYLVDPLVMYWNRTHFTQKGISQPPKYWDEMLTLVPQLTEKDEKNAIVRAAIPMGEYQNVNHAKEIFTTLMLQTGNQIVIENNDPEDEPGIQDYIVTLDDKLGKSVTPVNAAVNFYTQFANPSKDVYTWNRSLSNSLDAFIAGDLSMYFGFASEFATIRQKNPNLNFDVAVMPQSRIGLPTTYGRVLSLAIPRNNVVLERSFAFIMNMISTDAIDTTSDTLFLPPVRRDLLGRSPSNAFMQTFHNSALISENIFDFNPEELDQIFRRMIESSVSGSFSTSEAVARANEELELLAI